MIINVITLLQYLGHGTNSFFKRILNIFEYKLHVIRARQWPPLAYLPNWKIHSFSKFINKIINMKQMLNPFNM